MGVVMDKVGTHAAPNAKANAIIGKLLKEKDYHELLKFELVSEVMDYLRLHTHYGQIFIELNDDIEANEVMMKRHFFSAYEKLYHFYIDEYRDFFRALFMRYEVENLKLYLRAISRNEKLNSITSHLIISNLYSNLNYDSLNQSTNITEFLEAIKGTPYYSTLDAFVDEEPTSMVFHMEMVLDRGYFNTLYEAIMNLSSRDRELMLELLGINVDILNIQWIYRGRNYFDISSEELFNFTLNGGKRYDFKSLKKFCYMALSDFKTVVSSGDYKDIFADKDYMMERAMERQLFYELDNFTKKGGLSIVLPVVLLFKFEYEIRDLFTILEGIKYHVSDIGELLIRDLRRTR